MKTKTGCPRCVPVGGGYSYDLPALQKRGERVMKCPYCNKKVADMPDHLAKSQKCKEKHSEKLRNEFVIIFNQKEKEKILNIISKQ